MEITEEQYQQIASLFPVARRKAKLTNLAVLNAVLYLAEQGCKGRALSERFGPWHTIYMRWWRWNEQVVLPRVFAELPELGLPAAARAVLGLDSTSVKAHPDATGAPRKRDRKTWGNPTAAGAPRCPEWRPTTAPPCWWPCRRGKPTMAWRGGSC